MARYGVAAGRHRPVSFAVRLANWAVRPTQSASSGDRPKADGPVPTVAPSSRRLPQRAPSVVSLELRRPLPAGPPSRA